MVPRVSLEGLGTRIDCWPQAGGSFLAGGVSNHLKPGLVEKAAALPTGQFCVSFLRPVHIAVHSTKGTALTSGLESETTSGAVSTLDWVRD